MSNVDITIIVVYLVATFSTGLLMRQKQATADDYFTAGGEMKGFFSQIIVGLSLAATLFSGISFIAYPSIVYSDGIAVLFGLLAFPLGYLILRFWFLPRFLATGATEPYSIIESALGPSLRTFASAVFCLLLVGWMATLIYAPTIAIIAAANLSENWFWPIVIIIGMSSTLYTTVGGIKGVMIFDAIQMMVILLGVGTMLFFVATHLPAPISEVATNLREREVFDIDFSADPRITFTFWTILIGFSINNFSSWMSNQMSLQRYLSTGNAKASSRSFLVNVIGAGVVLIVLACIGLSLIAWYIYFPDSGKPDKADKVLPYFIANNLPTGLAGLILAAIIAATMSSITSGINTLASTFTFDFRMRFGSKLTRKQGLRFGRICSLVIGCLATLAAGFVNRLGSIFEITQTLMGFFLGPLFAIVLISVSGFKVHRPSIWVGICFGYASGVTLLALEWSSLLVGTAGLTGTLVVASLGTFLFRSRTLHNEN